MFRVFIGAWFFRLMFFCFNLFYICSFVLISQKLRYGGKKIQHLKKEKPNVVFCHWLFQPVFFVLISMLFSVLAESSQFVKISISASSNLQK